ncbi:hypothetical protein HMPREF1555_01255 [Porphyromonas gingivalis F0570]|uniref:Uncharacterized protein n=1 Tax=Porphyromonas gingivalis F0570 TaxID=1227271 RepID=A0A0E2LQK7_PORGN|nr:hypothetical protein HMPREF1555_01255 [Porphyromonas gingivalis F0570]
MKISNLYFLEIFDAVALCKGLMCGSSEICVMADGELQRS